jgi:hypothetical protein
MGMPFGVALVLDTPFSGSVFVLCSMIVSVLGLFLVRRRADIAWLKEHHEVASFFFLMVGTLYAVLIAFAIFVVWSQFQEAATNLQHEAFEVGDLSRMSLAMPDPLRRNIRIALLDYLHAVVDDEFPAMANNRDSPRTWQAVDKLWDVYYSADLDNPRMQIYFSESLRQLNDICDARRVRIFNSRGTVPPILWYLLYSGGILLVFFTYLFGHKSFWSQAGMTAALAGVLAFSLFLIAAYDSPYSGAARVSPTPLQLELVRIAARGT